MTKERFTSPVGRLVQGDAHEMQTQDAQGNLRVVKSGPNAGQPSPQIFLAVAFPKADPTGEFGQFYGLLLRKAAQDFPNLFPNAAHGDYSCVHPQFAFKVIDGDGIDANGKRNADKEGFAGHWVVRFASGFPPRIYDAGRYGPHDQIQEKGFIKRGYYVRVSGTVEGNGNAQKPGLYVNVDMVERSAFGPEIISGPDAGDAFGGGPAALPAGASATPVGGATPAPGAPPMPSGQPAMPPAAPPVAPGNAPAAPPYPAADSPAPANPAAPPAQPYAGYMGNPTPAAAPGAPAAPAASPVPPAASTPGLPTASPGNAAPPPPPAPAAPPPPPAAPGRVMLPAANGATYEQMIAAGWTDETLVTHGMMQA